MKQIYKPETDLEEAIEEVVEDGKTLSHSTYKKRKRILYDFKQNICDNYEDVSQVNELGTDLIKKYIQYRKKKGVSDLSIRKEITHIQKLATYYNFHEFNRALDFDQLRLNPKTKIEKSDKKPHITVEEYQEMLEVTEELRTELVLRIAWETGARASEIERIDVSDVDIEENEITIDEAKKENSSRKVYFDFSTKQKLKEYINLERDKYPNYNDTDALFLSHDGQRMTSSHISRKIASKAEEAGVQEIIGTNSQGHELRKVTAHSMRHSFAVHRLNEGMDVSYIARIMGDSVQTVRDTYLQLNDETVKEKNQLHRPKPY
jgi:integrase/recombinase XerD